VKLLFLAGLSYVVRTDGIGNFIPPIFQFSGFSCFSFPGSQFRLFLIACWVSVMNSFPFYSRFRFAWWRLEARFNYTAIVVHKSYGTLWHIYNPGMK
jgi:hypothetical protein